MEGVEHLYESKMIKRMELTLLEALGWRLSCTTPYSYIELLQWNIKSLKIQDFTSRVKDLLLGVLLGIQKHLETLLFFISDLTYMR